MADTSRIARTGAFFDVDGTLVRGFIIQSFPRFLRRKGLIAADFSNRIDSVVSEYNAERITYRSAAESVPALYASALQGLSHEEVRRYAKEFMRAYVPENIFPFAKELGRRVGGIVDYVIAVSGSPVEVVSELDLGFDRICGTILEIREGACTGVVLFNLRLGEIKAQFALEVCEDLKLDAAKSMAFGDTDQDVPLLNMVRCSVAINPNKPLHDICASKNWTILSEDDLKHLDAAVERLAKVTNNCRTQHS